MSDDGKRGDVYDVFGSDWEMSDAEEEKASAKSVEKEAKEPPDDGAKESDDDDELYDFGKRKKRKAKGTSTSRGSTRKKQRKRLKRASGEKVEEGREPGVGNEIGLDGDSGEVSKLRPKAKFPPGLVKGFFRALVLTLSICGVCLNHCVELESILASALRLVPCLFFLGSHSSVVFA